jgi:hypothetical protein
MPRPLLAETFALLLVVATLGQLRGQPAAQVVKPLTLAQIWTLDATYTDRLHGVTFRYPSVWRAEKQFGYHSPALTTSVEKPIAGFGYEEGGFPRGQVVGTYSTTNLEGFGIVYSAVPTANVTECESLATSLSDEPKHRTIVFGNRLFSERRIGQAGMSQSIFGSLYTTYVRPTCYLFETDVAVASPAVLNHISALTPAQLKSIDTHLLSIMKSVLIVLPEPR